MILKKSHEYLMRIKYIFVVVIFYELIILLSFHTSALKLSIHVLIFFKKNLPFKNMINLYIKKKCS